MRMQLAGQHAKPVPMRRSQYGAALILIMFMLGMGVVAFMLKSVNSGSFEFQQQDKTTLALNEAKEALIAWSASHPNWPGIMPFPDRKETTTPNYDGKSDCVNVGLNYNHLIGMLPISSESPCVSPQTGLGLQSYGVVKTCANGATSCDETGTRLWYAVSMNLIRTSSASGTAPFINPGVIDSPTVPWMRVLDRNGNLISDRVAAVIIAPGTPLANQDRSGLPDAADYLDSLQIGATVYSNSDYDTADEDFIMAPDSTRHPAVDVTYQSPYYFNDRLVYITIDELMAAVEKRVAAEVKATLNSYRSTYGAYPYAAPLGVTKNYSCKDNVNAGFLPLDTPISFSSTVSCTSNTNCSGLRFGNDIQSVTYTNPFINWSGTTGACTASGRSCTCTGTGSCTIFGFINFSCNQVSGICQSDFVMTGSSVYTPSRTDVISTTGFAGACSSQVSINGAGTFTGASCSDRGIAPKFTATTTISDDALTAAGGGFVSQNVQPGMYISGTGIPVGTVVESVASDTSLIMSNDATASGSVTIRISWLKSWFFDNSWQNYVYYAMSKTPGTFTVGARNNVDALLLTTGKAITSSPYVESKLSLSAQSRNLSCSPDDYLDSAENENGDSIYDVSSKPRKANYNDQMFIVSP
jgi:hypothetical protein